VRTKKNLLAAATEPCSLGGDMSVAHLVLVLKRHLPKWLRAGVTPLYITELDPLCVPIKRKEDRSTIRYMVFTNIVTVFQIANPVIIKLKRPALHAATVNTKTKTINPLVKTIAMLVPILNPIKLRV
jgi:hypothetical protein